MLKGAAGGVRGPSLGAQGRGDLISQEGKQKGAGQVSPWRVEPTAGARPGTGLWPESLCPRS